MVIVYGTRFYGRADVIEGLGHVTCRFVHIMFVPLFPIETVFLVSENRGMKLPFSFKAALSGWLRGGALMTGIGSLAGGVLEIVDGEILAGAALLVFALIAFGTFPLVGWLFGRCSHERRAELMRMFGVDPHEHGAPSAGAPMGFAPPAQPAFAGPPPPAGGFGQPPGYGAPPPMMGPSYGAPPQGYGGPSPYGAPPAYGAPPQAYGGPAPYGSPSQPPYGGPQPHAYGGQPNAYGGQPHAYGGPQPHAPSAPPQAPYGGPAPGYGPQGWDPNRR